MTLTHLSLSTAAAARFLLIIIQICMGQQFKSAEFSIIKGSYYQPVFQSSLLTNLTEKPVSTLTKCAQQCLANSMCVTASYYSGNTKICSLYTESITVGSIVLSGQISVLSIRKRNPKNAEITTTTTTSTTIITSTSTTIIITTTRTTTAITLPAPPCASVSNANGQLLNVYNPTSDIWGFPNYKCYSFNWIGTSTSATLQFTFRHDLYPNSWELDDISVYHGATQLITNGGFETGDLTGWTLDRLCTYGIYSSEVLSGSSYANTGSYYYYGFCRGVASSLTQTFTTIAGDTYQINFWLSNYYLGPSYVTPCCATTEIANITIG